MNFVHTTAAIEADSLGRGLQSKPGARLAASGLLGLHILAFAAPIILTLFFSGLAFPLSDLIAYASLFTLGTLIWCMWSWNYIGQSLFSPYGITLIAMYLYHSGQFFLALLGAKTGLLGHIFDAFRFREETLVATQILILLGLGGLHFGALLTALRLQELPADSPRNARFQVSEQSARIVGWILIVIAILPTILILRDLLTLRFKADYGAIWQQEQTLGLDNWQAVLAGALLPGALFLLAGSKGRHFSISVATCCIFLQCLGYLIVGQRSTALMPLLGFAWVFHNSIRPIPKTVLLVGAAILIALTPLIQKARKMPLEAVFSADTLMETYFSVQNPLVSFLDEAGMSVVPACDTLELVPRRRGFDMGAGYLNALVGPVNFLVPVNFIHGYDANPGIWLIETRYPIRFKRHTGIGYSSLAEAYLQFGWIGVPFVMALAGALIVRFTYWATWRMDPARIAAVGTFMVILPLFTRGTAVQLGRPLLRYSLLPLLLVLLLNAYRQRVHASRSDDMDAR